MWLYIACFFLSFKIEVNPAQENVKVDDKQARLKQFTTTIIDLKIQIPKSNFQTISKSESPMTQTFIFFT